MTDPSSEPDPVEKLAEEFLARLRTGQRPALTEYTEKYPVWAERIRKVFPALVLMEGVRLDAKEATAAGSEGVPVAPERCLERLGDYRILRQVGEGGMGIVYEAEQESLGRHVALKILPAHALLEPKHLHRFQREAKAAARLHHTNIVPVYGVGADAGLHYYVMQFIQGLGLDEVLVELRRLRQARKAPARSPTGTDQATPSGRRSEVSAAQVAQGLLTGQFVASPPAAVEADSSPRTPVPASLRPEGVDSPAPRGNVSAVRGNPAIHLPGQRDGSRLSESGRPYWQSVARVGIQVAEALAYAHSQGILHRDIKPSNLLLDTQGNVWVTDFGLAKAADSQDLTHSGDIVGTVRYLAPERFQGKADARSDLYALGLTLYELLTLRSAFDESDRNKLIAQVMHAEPPRPRQLNPDMPRDLETIILKTLEHEPARRYANATELADDLKRFVAGEPIRARRVSAWQRLVLWARRRPAVAALIAVSGVAALAVVAVVVGSVYNTRLQRALDDTEQARQEAEQARQEEADQRQKAAKALAKETTLRYFNRILLAEREWWANNVGRTRQLLDDCPPDRRGWEWKYLRRLCESDLLTFTGASSVAFSPDGQHLATAGRDKTDKTVQIRDAATGKVLRTLLGHTLRVRMVSFSPDGQRLASVTGGVVDLGPAEVMVWDVATSQPIRTFNSKETLSSVAFSPDGRYLAWGTRAYGKPGEVKVWDVMTQEVRTFGRHAGRVSAVAFSPDGKRLASACIPGSDPSLRNGPGEIKVWDATNGQQLWTPRGPLRGIGAVAFSPDGQRLASTSYDGTVKVWDATTGQEVFTLRGHTDGVNSVAFSPDGQRLASTSDDATVKVWDATTGKEIFTLRGHTGVVQDLAFSRDGERLASVSHDGTVKVWDPMAEQEALTLRGHRGQVTCLAFHPDGSRLAAAGSVRRLAIQIADPATGQELQLLHGAAGDVWSLAFSPDGRRLAAGTAAGRVVVWDCTTGQIVHRLRAHRVAGGMMGVAFSPDGKYLASGGWDQTVKIWDATSGQELRSLTGHTDYVLRVAFSPDGRRLASASLDKTAKVWDVTTGQELRTLTGHTDVVVRAVFSPDGRSLASASDDRTVKLWDLTTSQEPRTLYAHPSVVRDVAFSPDGQLLATASFDRTVKVWDVPTLQEVLTLRGHTDRVWAVAFSPDGQRLASGGVDETVKVWEVTPLTPELRLRRQAVALVNRLGAELVFKEDVSERLHQDASVGEALRRQALALMEQYKEDPHQLNRASYVVVRRPGADAAAYQRALRQAEAALRLAPPDYRFFPIYHPLTQLGIAQYRLGRYREARDSLIRAEALFSAEVLQADRLALTLLSLPSATFLAPLQVHVRSQAPWNLAILAMTHHQFGDPDKAQAVLDRLRGILKDPRWKSHQDAQSFWREAEALLQGPAPKRDP
ncbi:MAG: protein kinase [Gemmataceae bacterium]|nr:protein kinase [Gemmataceae bacterium]